MTKENNSKQIFKVFDHISKVARSNERLMRLSQNELTDLGMEYFNAGLNYFKNYSDNSYLRKIGIQMLKLLAEEKVKISIKKVTAESDAKNSEYFIDSDGINFFLDKNKKNEKNQIVIPVSSGFINEAAFEPIGGIGKIAQICSIAYDIYNGRESIDKESIIPRSWMCYMEVVKEAKKQGRELNVENMGAALPYIDGLNSNPNLLYDTKLDIKNI